MKNVIFQLHDTGSGIACGISIDSPDNFVTNGDMASVIFTAASFFRANVQCGCDRCGTLKAACDMIVSGFGADVYEDTIGDVAGCA